MRVKMINKIKNISWNTAIITGISLGIFGIWLDILGNPNNSGLCISCFMENIAGAINLHTNIRMSYLRPEIIGLVIGSFLLALLEKKFKVKGGSSPLIRFFMGFYLMVGAAIFIGCPVKATLRLALGDLTAVFAILGFITGVWFGLQYLRGGFVLEKEKKLGIANGLALPLFMVMLLFFLILKPAFILLGTQGPAAMHAPIWISLIAGLIMGGFGQQSTFCMMAGFRNFFIAKDTRLLKGIITFFGVAAALALATGRLHFGLNGQPGSHTAHGWTFLGMFLVGGISVLANGCPFRQVIMAGEGNADAGLIVLGMLLGGGIVHSWGIRSTIAGPTFLGKIAVLTGLIFLITIGIVFRTRNKKVQEVYKAQEEQWTISEYEKKHYIASIKQ